MSKTLIDDPPPGGEPRPTIVDDPYQPPAADPAYAPRSTVLDAPEGAPPEPAATPPSGPKPPSKRGRLGCAIAAIVLTLAALVGGGLWLYFGVIHYEPVARRHIPGNANMAARLDAVGVATFAPVRKHLWPLLDAAPGGKTRKSRLEDAGISPTDIREILVASTDATSWVVLLGGRIDKGRAVTGIEKVIREEGWPGWRRDGEVLVGPGGVTIGQAEDGTLLLGTDTSIVRASLNASDDWKRIGLPEGGEMTFVVTREAWDGVGGEIGGLLTGGRGLFRRAGRTTGAFTLGDTPRIAMKITPASGETAAALAGDLQGILSGLKIVTLLLPDQMGEKRALQSAVVSAAADGADLQATWPLDGLDQACQRLAASLKTFTGP